GGGKGRAGLWPGGPRAGAGRAGSGRGGGPEGGGVPFSGRSPPQRVIAIADMLEPTRRIAWPPADATDPEALVTREFLVTNGLGGYASGTVSGVITRRYHGILIAALPAPLGRIVMLSTVAEQVRLADGREVEIGGRERSGDAPDARGHGYLTEFRLEAGLPVWHYDVDGIVIEKRIFLSHMQNTVHVTYELVSGADRVELALRP